jgi:hypothetical protein
VRRDFPSARMSQVTVMSPARRKAALDMRLVEPFGELEPDTKLTVAVRRIKTVWAETSATT